MTDTAIQERLDALRAAIEAEDISYGEIVELQSLAEHIDPSDVVLRQWAGVPEFPERARLVIYAKLTDQGTAASETALCQDDYYPFHQDALAATAGADVTGPWSDCTGNDALRCQVCGRDAEGNDDSADA